MSYWISNSPQGQRIRAFCDVAGTRDLGEAVVRLAGLIRSKSRQDAPPFSAHLYCKPYNVSVEDQWLIDCDARLLPIPGGFVAEVQANHSAARKQFSICHELAHIFFDYKGSGSDGISCGARSREERIEERLCDRIAVELLMPQEVFSVHAARLPAELASVKYLANKFQVSLQTAMRRVVELNIWDCGFVNYQTSQSGALRIRNWQVSEIWRDSSRSFFSGNLLGNEFRSAAGQTQYLFLPGTSRNFRVEWYACGGRLKTPLTCAFLSAVSVTN